MKYDTGGWVEGRRRISVWDDKPLVLAPLRAFRSVVLPCWSTKVVCRFEKINQTNRSTLASKGIERVAAKTAMKITQNRLTATKVLQIKKVRLLNAQVFPGNGDWWVHYCWISNWTIIISFFLTKPEVKNSTKVKEYLLLLLLIAKEVINISKTWLTSGKEEGKCSKFVPHWQSFFLLNGCCLCITTIALQYLLLLLMYNVMIY